MEYPLCGWFGKQNALCGDRTHASEETNALSSLAPLASKYTLGTESKIKRTAKNTYSSSMRPLSEPGWFVFYGHSQLNYGGS
jgi:hypothetical protein